MYITCHSCCDVQSTHHKSSSVHQDESEALSVPEKFAEKYMGEKSVGERSVGENGEKSVVEKITGEKLWVKNVWVKNQ